MIRRSLRTAWEEPRVPNAPRRLWRDWFVAGALIPAAILEMIFRENAGWKPGAIAISFVLAAAVLWRRTEPLKTTIVAFSAIIALDYVSWFFADHTLEYYTAAMVLIVPYALFRWGSGREAMIGSGVMLVAFVHFNFVDWTGFGDAIGGLFVMLFPAALGDIVRNQHRSRAQALEKVKMSEREQLARELHDTVAHHVSAIAIQAQAGRAVFTADPDAAMRALTTIEEEASRTLVEMRTMVTALRTSDHAEFAPQAAFDDIERLARVATASPSTTLPITVERSGDLDMIEPSIDRALFRLAQESITNATRHARRATAVNVHLHGDAEEIRLTVTDDGDPRPFDATTHNGFGLVGMTERAHLLGGTLVAGPRPGRGWSVDAVLPRSARARSGAGS